MAPSNGSVLIVDAETEAGESLAKWFQREGYAARAVSRGGEALAAAAERPFDVVLVEGGLDGREHERLRNAHPDLRVIEMSGDVDRDELSRRVAGAIEHGRARHEAAVLREALREASPDIEPIGRSVNEFIQIAGRSDASVFIGGESGAGKEVVARAIHRASSRRLLPFVAVRCAAAAEAEVESELFGRDGRMGKIEAARGGALFLDEIGALSPKTQAGLVEALRYRDNARCIAATSRNLAELSEAGAFRPDLYFKLRGLCIDLLPLRRRRDDIPLLADSLIRQLCSSLNRPAPLPLSMEVLNLLAAFDWPGNVDQLRNALERALIANRGGELRPSDFEFQFPPGGRLTLDEVERRHIERVLVECHNNRSLASRVLGIDRTTLYNKLRRYQSG